MCEAYLSVIWVWLFNKNPCIALRSKVDRRRILGLVFTTVLQTSIMGGLKLSSNNQVANNKSFSKLDQNKIDVGFPWNKYWTKQARYNSIWCC